MERTHIEDLKEHKGKEVLLKGWINIRRDHGKLIFIDLRDATGRVQMVVLPNHEDAQKQAGDVRPEWLIEVKGIVNERPEKMVKADEQNGDIEIEATEITVISRAAELPFEIEAEVNLDTHLDHLPLTLRNTKSRSIFKIQSEIIHTFRNFLKGEGFTEIQAPKLIGEDAEGGANSFNIEYFGHTAHLAQSPQLYKQIMVGIFERVFATGNVYRAEKHATTRHLNEYTSLDFEMGFIENHEDVMRMENDFLLALQDHLRETCVEEFKTLEAEEFKVPENIPKLKLREAQEILQKEYRIDCQDEPDLEPQHERLLCEYAKERLGSDFIFVTHFPLDKRPFYTYEDPEDKGYAGGFDLLFRGIEITTGAQRIHDYNELVAAMKRKKLNPEQFSFYLQAFKYGMPPHGGIGIGLERLTAKILGLENVKEATLFPRDLNRIDNLLSKNEDNKS